MNADSLIDETIDKLISAEKKCKLLPADGSARWFVAYLWHEESDAFIWLVYRNGDIDLGLLKGTDNAPLTKTVFNQLWDEYYRFFIEGHFSDEDSGSEIWQLWKKLYGIFIEPVLPFIKKEGKYTLFSLFSIDIFDEKTERNCFINIPLLYDLCYRYECVNKNYELYFVNVSDSDPANFIENLSHVPYASAGNIALLYGLLPQDSKELLSQCRNDEERAAAIFREKTLCDALRSAEQQGTSIQYLVTEDQFNTLFSKGQENKIILLIAHFHDESIFVRERNKYIFAPILVNLINDEKGNGTLREDISINALTCTNYDVFKQFYESGVKNIFYTAHNISSDIAAYMLWELYNGYNARMNDIPFPYLDGKTWFFDVWARVSRCFYSLMFQNKKIRIMPALQEVTITGASANELRIFIERQIADKKLDKSAFEKKESEFREGHDKLSMDFVALFMELDKAILIEVIADYIFWLIKGKGKKKDKKKEDAQPATAEDKPSYELVITKKDANGNDVPYKLSNLSKEDAIDILKSM